MLQDLDALSQRIRQVTQLTRELQSERTDLQARVRQLEQECQALKDQQLREGEEFARMSQRLARHDQELQAAREESGQHRAALESDLRDHQIRSDSLQRRLTQVEAERDNLRDAAVGAQQQIELILERLPGAEA
jgi:predicted  nucleic acid-binding Zn-ribbon protein